MVDDKKGFSVSGKGSVAPESDNLMAVTMLEKVEERITPLKKRVYSAGQTYTFGAEKANEFIKTGKAAKTK